jgi:hypothetical protein
MANTVAPVKGQYRTEAENSATFAENPAEAYRLAVEKAFKEGVGDQDGNGTFGDHEDRSKWLVDEMGIQGATEFDTGIIDKQVKSGELTEEQRASREAQMLEEHTAAGSNETGFTTPDPRVKPSTSDSTDAPEADPAAAPAAAPVVKDTETQDIPVPADNNGARPAVSNMRDPMRLRPEEETLMDAGFDPTLGTIKDPKQLKQLIWGNGVDKTLAYAYHKIDDMDEYSTEAERTAAKKAVRDEVVKINADLDPATTGTYSSTINEGVEEQMDEIMKKRSGNFDHDDVENSAMDKTTHLVIDYGADATIEYKQKKFEKSDEYASMTDDERLVKYAEIRDEVATASIFAERHLKDGLL